MSESTATIENNSAGDEDAVQMGAEVQIKRTLLLTMLFLYLAVISVVVGLGIMNRNTILAAADQQQGTLTEFSGRVIELGLETSEMGAIQSALKRLSEFREFRGAVLMDTEKTALLAQPSGFEIPQSIKLQAGQTVRDDNNNSYQLVTLEDSTGEALGELAIAFTAEPVIAESRSTLWFACGISALILTPLILFAGWKIIRQVRPLGLVVAQSAEKLVGSSQNLSAVSLQMSANAERTSDQATRVTDASKQVSEHVQTVAAAVEEMGASVKEISKNVSDATRVANEAVGVADKTNTNVTSLGESSREIGKVIEVIQDIAEQTKVLALNATIEAARAGESGKGFAVVANEVKELARETAAATEDISQRIEAIQNDTGAAIESINQIREIISQINESQNMIASAIQEQHSTTGEISRNVTEAARRSKDIVENITEVAEAAQDTFSTVGNTQKAAEELSSVADGLRQRVGRFRF